MCAEDIELARSRGLFVIACNDNWVHRPDLLYVPDYTWANANVDGWSRCENRLTCAESIVQAYPGWKHIEIANGNAFTGLSFLPGFIHNGGFAGYQMINVATLAGCRNIILTGYDCQMTDGKLRWRGTHPPGVEKGTGGGKFQKWAEILESIPPDLEMIGATVINATRSTAVRCFPIMPIEEALDHVATNLSGNA